MNGKFYWLKLKRDFFKRHDIKILEAMPDGQLSVLFYLKLMLEAIDHEGTLRFSDKVPYSPEMLATITNTDVEVARVSIERLQDFGLIEIAQDGTIIVDKVKTMIDCASDSDAAKRQKRYRERKKQKHNEVLQQNVTPVTPVTTNNNESKSIEIEKEKDIEIEIDSKEKSIKEKANAPLRFMPPSVEEVRAYCQERNNGIDPETFVDFYEAKGWFIGKNKMKDWKAAVRTWERERKKNGNPVRTISNSLPSGNPFTELKRKEGYLP